MDKNDPSGQQKQEFSFTLYDFDGHGKITKDVSIFFDFLSGVWEN